MSRTNDQPKGYIHPQTGKEVGYAERCQGTRYWVGGCTCGSGLEGHETYDDNGIYFGIGCRKCRRQAAPGPYDEAIEADDY